MTAKFQESQDEWIIANTHEAENQFRKYIVHLIKPRFTAQIVKYDDNGIPDPEYEPADFSMPYRQVDLEVTNGYIVLFNFDWIDQAEPEVEELLMRASSVAFEIHEAQNKLYKLHILENEDLDSI